MATKTVTQSLKLKNGDTIPVGTRCDLKFSCEYPYNVVIACPTVGASGRSYQAQPAKIGPLSTAKTFGMKAPGIRAMEKWSDDGIARSMLGAKVEPDGCDPNGSPSWLLVLGYI